MTTSPLPTDTIIEIDSQSDLTRYSWPATERHPMQWMPMLFGAVMIIQAFVVVAITIFDN